jgi:hypothetical protein
VFFSLFKPEKQNQKSSNMRSNLGIAEKSLTPCPKKKRKRKEKIKQG